MNDEEALAAQSRQSARDDAVWRNRMYVNLGLAFLAAWATMNSDKGYLLSAFACGMFTIATVRAGKAYLWPER